MKLFIMLVLLYSFAYSKVYYSKVEPYEFRDISSNVSGLITKIDEDMIGKVLSKYSYILIDSVLDTKEYLYTKKKLNYTLEVLYSSEDILKNMRLSLDKKRKNYKKIKNLKIKSLVEKDREFHSLVSSENLYLNTKKEIDNLKIKILDLKFKIASLEKKIKDKKFIADGFLLYSIKVKVGQVVGISTPLAQIADISKAKLTIYLDREDLLNLDNKTVYIDGEKTTYKITRILKIADSINISKYKAQIIISSPSVFSKLVKVELRDE